METRYSLSRRDYLRLEIPNVKQMISIEYLDSKTDPKKVATLSKGFESNILPSLRYLNEMLQELKSTGNDYAIFNGTYLFGLGDLYSSKVIHEMKEVKESVRVEQVWFQKLGKGTIKTPPNFHFQDFKEKLNEFQEILLNGRDHVYAREDNKKLTTGCLAFLVGKKWLDISIIKEFLDIRNRNDQAEPCISYKQLQDEHSSGELANTVEEWLRLGASRVCVVANVGIKKGKTFFATQTLFGSHWICFQVDIAAKRILYCDSLVWSPPENFFDDIKFFTDTIESIFNLPTDEYTITFAHKTLKPPTRVHRCNQDCLSLPYQGPNMTICGVAALISAILLSDKGLDQTTLPESLKWLQQIHQYNDFARCLFIKWYVQRNIEAKDIWFSEKVSYQFVLTHFYGEQNFRFQVAEGLFFKSLNNLNLFLSFTLI